MRCKPGHFIAFDESFLQESDPSEFVPNPFIELPDLPFVLLDPEGLLAFACPEKPIGVVSSSSQDINPVIIAGFR